MPAAASPRDLLRLRLLAHGLGGDGLPSPAAVVERMLGVQAQDLRAALWAVGVRSPGSTVADVTAAIDAGSIVRSWPMRGTLHLVPAADLHWMLQLTTPRLVAGSAGRWAQLELDTETGERAREVVQDALAGGRELTRAGFLRVLQEHGIDTSGQRGYHLIWYLAQTGTLCWGRTDGNGQVLVLLDEWVRKPRELDRDEALGEFLLRYVRGHGPASLRDFVGWTQLTVADAKAARAVAGDRLAEVRVGDDVLYYEAASDVVPLSSDGAAPRTSDAVLALPGFDEYLLGYKNRGFVIDDDLFEWVVPGRNGLFLPIVVAGGRVAGTWRTTGTGRSLRAELRAFAPVSATRRAGFERGIRRYSRFLGTPVTIAAAD